MTDITPPSLSCFMTCVTITYDITLYSLSKSKIKKIKEKLTIKYNKNKKEK